MSYEQAALAFYHAANAWMIGNGWKPAGQFEPSDMDAIAVAFLQERVGGTMAATIVATGRELRTLSLTMLMNLAFMRCENALRGVSDGPDVTPAEPTAKRIGHG